MMHIMVGRVLLFLFLLILALIAIAMISVLSAEREEIRRLPRGAWVAITPPAAGPWARRSTLSGLGRPDPPTGTVGLPPPRHHARPRPTTTPSSSAGSAP